MEENEKNWLDKLSDEIEEMLANPKAVKFNTHKNRKLFTGDLIGKINRISISHLTPLNRKVWRAVILAAFSASFVLAEVQRGQLISRRKKHRLAYNLNEPLENGWSDTRIVQPGSA